MPTPTATTQLALQDGEDFRSVDLTLTPGGLDLSAHDIRPLARRTWGENYEFGVKIAAKDLPRLALALVAEHYRGDLQAVDKLRALAERHGIEPHFWSWP